MERGRPQKNPLLYWSVRVQSWLFPLQDPVGLSTMFPTLSWGPPGPGGWSLGPQTPPGNSNKLAYIQIQESTRVAGSKISTVRALIIGPCARTLELPLLVWSGVFFLFPLSRAADFWCVFRPFSRGGNFGLHSTWPDYSSSYSSERLTERWKGKVPYGSTKAQELALYTLHRDWYIQ